MTMQISPQGLTVNPGGPGLPQGLLVEQMCGFTPRSLLFGPRYVMLDYRQSYYDCTQHNKKTYDFDGRVIEPATAQGVTPVSSMREAPYYVPLRQRRPSNPVRLGKVIVDASTSLVFGENRFPQMKVEGDNKSQDWTQAVVKAGRLPLHMIRARNIGGGMGTVAISWCFYEGLPRFEVHNPKNLFVHKWANRALLIPEWVTEVYTFYKTQWDGKQFARVHYWFRRDWHPAGDIVFKPSPFQPGKEPVWEIDEAASSWHEDGVCHLQWIQNFPSDEADGIPDYEGLYDQLDTLDVLSSVVAKGAILNLDPTLVLALDQDYVDKKGIQKGSNNSLVVGTGGSANYLELSGAGITAGLALMEHQRKSILETSQTVILNPDVAAAQGMSSVAQKLAYAPMLSKCDVLREQYGSAVERMLETMIKVAQKRSSTKVTITNTATGEEEEATVALVLPPRVEETPRVDALGQPVIDPETGDQIVDVVNVPRVPGEGGDISLLWPPYFQPTADDQSKVVTTLQLANGGKALLSVETSTELAANVFGLDAASEKKRVEEEAMKSKAAAAEMTPGIGGEVTDPNELPEGATPRRPRPPMSENLTKNEEPPADGAGPA